MIKRYRAVAAVFAVVALSAMAVAQLEGLLKSAFKIGGVVVIASQFGKDIDKGINSLTGFKSSTVTSTKVVPILSIGQGGYIGLAQVMGPKKSVDKVQAVGQLEGDFAGRALRLRGLIPISTKKADKTNINRVDGVGVSAIVDIKL